jgi:hypothetical protein
VHFERKEIYFGSWLQSLKRISSKLGMVAHSVIPATWEAEIVGSQFQIIQEKEKKELVRPISKKKLGTVSMIRKMKNASLYTKPTATKTARTYIGKAKSIQ